MGYIHSVHTHTTYWLKLYSYCCTLGLLVYTGDERAPTVNFPMSLIGLPMNTLTASPSKQTTKTIPTSTTAVGAFLGLGCLLHSADQVFTVMGMQGLAWWFSWHHTHTIFVPIEARLRWRLGLILRPAVSWAILNRGWVWIDTVCLHGPWHQKGVGSGIGRNLWMLWRKEHSRRSDNVSQG